MSIENSNNDAEYTLDAERDFSGADTYLEGENGYGDDDVTLDTDIQEDLVPNKNTRRRATGQLVGGADFDGYRLIQPLGAGSFGVVFKASKDGQLFALKILKDETDNREVIARFKREAKVLAQLNHANILKIYDFGVSQGRPYLALEFVEGHSLRQLLKDKKQPSYDQARLMMCAVASGLAHCHSKGIVHRDLKPGNIIIEKASGRPVIVDFGLVYKDDRRQRSGELVGFTKNLSIKGFIKGTPQFMSPEQADPDSQVIVAAPSDVWAFGATLYNLLTGELLFPEHRGLEVLEPLVNGRIPKIQTVKPDIPKPIAQLCQLCLQLEAIHRPTMFELAKFLRGSEESFHERRVTGVLTRPKQESQVPILPFIVSAVMIVSFAILYFIFG